MCVCACLAVVLAWLAGTSVCLAALCATGLSAQVGMQQRQRLPFLGQFFFGALKPTSLMQPTHPPAPPRPQPLALPHRALPPRLGPPRLRDRAAAL